MWRGRKVSRELFLKHVADVAEGLPAMRYALNLCEDRYLFLVAFAAALARGQSNLLPPSRLPSVVDAVAQDYEGTYSIAEALQPQLSVAQHRLPALRESERGGSGAVPSIPAEHLAAIAFTSGSTGRPRPNPKRWGDLVHGSLLAQDRFGMRRGLSLVATVPPQHMYGLETSILLPLIAGITIHGGRPFFPKDVQTALSQIQSPRILITTPVHLRACVGAGIEWPEIAFVISATAPLSALLAARAEETFGAPVLEIYGSTESGSIASRRTVHEDRWNLYDELSIQVRDGSAVVSGGHLCEPITLNDHVEIHDRHSFALLGRHTDMVNIAGKRTSLADLNQKLQEIEGVQDGVFTVPESSTERTVRLMALVVAPGLSKEAVLAALAERVEPAFMPRPLHLVERLPRGETGKLPRAALRPLLEGLGTEP